MVMDFASCATGPITCLHHRNTREHTVSRLDWPLSRLQPQGQLDELANLVHLSHTSLILTAVNFSKDRDPWGETSGSPNLCLEYHCSSICMNGCQNEERFFYSGWFPYWPFSEPYEPVLLEGDPWDGTATVDSTTKCSSPLLQHMEKSGGRRFHCFFTARPLHAKSYLDLAPDPAVAGENCLVLGPSLLSVAPAFSKQVLKLKPLHSTSTIEKLWQFTWKYGSQLPFSNCHYKDRACVEVFISTLMNCETGPSSLCRTTHPSRSGQ